MTVDHDGKIRMDCSSPYAMAGWSALKDQYPTSRSATTPTRIGTGSSPPPPG